MSEQEPKPTPEPVSEPTTQAPRKLAGGLNYAEILEKQRTEGSIPSLRNVKTVMGPNRSDPVGEVPSLRKVKTHLD